MTQDTWQYQGRQQHGEWGHGTAPHDEKTPPTRGAGRENPPAPTGIAERAAYVAYGVVAHLPLSSMAFYEARLHRGMLADFQKAMTSFPASARLDDDAYRVHVLGDLLNPEETHELRIAGLVIHTARTLDDLAPATTALANVVKSAGLSFTERGLGAAATANPPASHGRIQMAADTGSSAPVEQTPAPSYGTGTRVILPNGQTVPPGCTTDCLMSPVADLSPVAAAGRKVGATYRALLENPETAGGAYPYLLSILNHYLGHGGVFDYQRQGNYIAGFVQFRQYRDVSNFNVGLFCQAAGLSRVDMLKISGFFAKHFSSNADPNEPYGLDKRTANFMNIGFTFGESGVFDGDVR